MGVLASISGKEAVKAFAKIGWSRAGQMGSHLTMTKAGVRSILTIPQHKELAAGTLRSLIRNAGINVDVFLSLL